MRWRDVKKRADVASPSSSSLPRVASFSKRLKAFVIDSFMLLMPILYTVFYLVFGSREGFAEHMLTGWLLVLMPYGMVTSLFLALKGQTPGYKAYDIVLYNIKTFQKASLPTILWRYLLFILTCMTLVGLLLPLFRKDTLGVYDLLSHSAPYQK